jgi:hypothetical protein
MDLECAHDVSTQPIWPPMKECTFPSGLPIFPRKGGVQRDLRPPPGPLLLKEGSKS